MFYFLYFSFLDDIKLFEALFQKPILDVNRVSNNRQQEIMTIDSCHQKYDMNGKKKEKFSIFLFIFRFMLSIFFELFLCFSFESFS